MEAYVLWFIAGVVLIIVELLTGTMYLLVLGIGALVAAALAFFLPGVALLWQVIALGAGAGVALVALRGRKAKSDAPAPGLEQDAPVAFESWLDRDARRARVKFRGAQWDAIVEGECEGRVGEVLYVRSVNGPTLVIAKKS